MQIFLDTANHDEIKRGVATGCAHGVTTNPTIISREGKPLRQCLEEIMAINPELTVLVEVVESDAGTMIAEARELSRLAPRLVVKIPMTPDGLAAVRVLSLEGIKTTVTLVFSLSQAITASCAGADFVAPFVGRLDDISANGIGLVENIKKTFMMHGVKTRIIAASLRTPQAAAELFAVGCDIVTMPVKVLEMMLHHPLTDSGLRKFAEDGKKVPEGTPCR